MNKKPVDMWMRNNRVLDRKELVQLDNNSYQMKEKVLKNSKYLRIALRVSKI